MLFYNKDMFDAAGLPYPSADEPLTVDEFADLAAQLSNDAENLEDKVWGGAAEVMFWWSDPGYLFTEDGSTATFDDQATMHAHQVLADVVLNGDGPSGSDYELLGFEDLMAEGFIAMSVLDNIWGVEVLEEGGINYGVAPVPLEQAGDSPWVSSWTDSFGVFADSDHPEEALKFMRFMATEGNRLRLETGWLPLNLKLAEAEGYAEESEANQQILKVMSFGRDSVFVPYFWDVTADVWDAWDTILEGDSAADVFPEYNEYMQESLDDAWETWDSIE
jgi:multiple sugar transport system substrate-binding protein